MTDGMSNHYPQRQITEIQLRYVTINQTLTELFYIFHFSKGGSNMKVKSFKKELDKIENNVVDEQ